jgi:hypothetical protein
MSGSRKLERDFVRADVAAVGALLSQLDEEDVMARFGLEARLQELQTIDQRLLGTTREFFDLMRHSAATMRLLAGETDRSFGVEAVARAAERAKTTTVEEFDDSVVGQLAGVLPEAHQFEFRGGAERGVIRGKVDKNFSSNQLAMFNRDWVNVTARADLRVKRVLSNGAVVREKYTLVSIGPDKKLGD